MRLPFLGIRPSASRLLSGGIASAGPRSGCSWAFMNMVIRMGVATQAATRAAQRSALRIDGPERVTC